MIMKINKYKILQIIYGYKILPIMHALSVAGIYLSIFWISYSTLTAMINIFAPPPGFVLDWHYEINLVASALNCALPIGILSIIALIILGIIQKRINFSMIILSIYSLFFVSVFSAVLFRFMSSVFDVDLWSSRIWWII